MVCAGHLASVVHCYRCSGAKERKGSQNRPESFTQKSVYRLLQSSEKVGEGLIF